MNFATFISVYPFFFHFSWCEAALQAAKTENLPLNQMNKILQLIEDGKEDHDEKYMDFPMNSMFEESYRINTVPYVSSQGSLISENLFTLVPSITVRKINVPQFFNQM